ncbi:MAG: hypothetical protein IT578_06135 [Verrucomicrobiae bacterium]|nr:hypothetical protein [Verrucomicrobiae bacterium]
MSNLPSHPPEEGDAPMPAPLSAELRALDRRVLPHDLENLIVRLCAWKPQSLREISRYLRRDDIYLQNTALKRLLADGRLEFLHPEQPNHPRQAYVPGKGKGARRRARTMRPPSRLRAASPPSAAPSVSPPPSEMEMPEIGVND